MMVLDGLWGTLSPRSGFQFWQTYLRDKLPRNMNKMYKDYSLLSDNSIRYLSVWTVLVGLFVLALSYFGTSKSGFGGAEGGKPWQQGTRS
jgi:hypothetical protein